MRRIDNLLEGVINGNIRTPIQIRESGQNDLLSAEGLQKCIYECKNEILSKVDKLRSNMAAKEYIQKEQLKYAEYSKRLLAMEDYRGKIFQMKKSVRNFNDLVRFAYRCSDEISNYLEKRFNMFVDKNLPASYMTKLYEVPGITNDVNYILEREEGKEIDKKIWAIVKFILMKCHNAAFDVNISLEHLEYMKIILRRFKKLSEEDMFNEEEIIDSLIYYNYNASKFFHYLAKRIKSEVEELNDTREKIDRLNFYLNKFSQQYVKEKVKYTCDHKSIKNQIKAWLTEEIRYAASRLEYTITEPIKSDFENNDEKIETNLPVSQIAYFTNLQFQTGVYTDKNKSNTLRIISQVMSSRNQQNISFQSLQKKFYEADNTTREAIRDILIKMLNLTRR
ncbi:MAG: hypothetical protein JXR58_01365 [Bacteroidales bacterium]|nr:hypothetical protein [Bacteroidales bacterium]